MYVGAAVGPVLSGLLLSWVLQHCEPSEGGAGNPNSGPLENQNLLLTAELALQLLNTGFLFFVFP